MEQKILQAVKELLQEQPEPEEIPIQRAVSALGVSSLMRGHGEYHMVEYQVYPTNLYLTFKSMATRDETGNFNSPIFQNDHYNGYKPLWQEFRERFEAEIGTSVTQVFFGNYIKKGHDERFIVEDEPKDCRYRYTKKRDKDTIYITYIAEEQAYEYQEILDEIRFERASKIVLEREARKESRICRKEAIITLNSKYSDEFERFTFDDETFRFRQFNTAFFYTPEGLAAFDEFYVKVCTPYRNEEIEEKEWEEKSRQLSECILNGVETELGLRVNLTQSFQIKRTEGNGCVIESDLIDDRTGRQFSLAINSQKFDDILSATIAELTVVFQRKKQIKRAVSVLQSLASS